MPKIKSNGIDIGRLVIVLESVLHVNGNTPDLRIQEKITVLLPVVRTAFAGGL
jgi:hypothetical protein